MPVIIALTEFITPSICHTGPAYMNTDPTATTSAICNCAPGANSNNLTGSALVCTSSTSCTASQFYSNSSCVAISATCEKGYFYSYAATLINDRVCTACGPGFFATVATNSMPDGFLLSQCLSPVDRSCPRGTYFANAATSTTDRVCTVCSTGTFSASTTDSTSAGNVLTQCATAITVCNTGSAYSNTPATPSSDAICACASNTFHGQAGVIGVNGTDFRCLPFTVCPTGSTYDNIAGTPTSNAVCKCANNAWSPNLLQCFINEDFSSLLCTLDTVCPTGSAYNNIAKTPVSDAICACASGASNGGGTGANLNCQVVT